jgi:hypothetical protein
MCVMYVMCVMCVMCDGRGRREAAGPGMIDRVR